MSVIHPNETARNWRASKATDCVQLFLSPHEADAAAALIAATVTVAGFPLSLSVVEPTSWIDPEELRHAAVAVVQVDVESATSLKRFEHLARAAEIPLIAAAYEPPLAFVRSLIRTGAHDVIPLPVSCDDLESSIAPIEAALKQRTSAAKLANGKVVSIIKAAGGVGATALLTQLTTRYAQKEARFDRQTCLIDMDVQFGDVAFQLGLQPSLSLTDLLDASSRLDGDLLLATTAEHPSGLKVIASAREMVPLESVPSEQMLKIVDSATQEFNTVFLDLPTDWTNWSLSLVARSNLVILVAELTVTSLNRARRQLNLLASQDLDDLDVRVLINRYDKSLARNIGLTDASKAIGRDVSFTISNDFALVRSAIDRGIQVGELKRKTLFGRDIDILDEGIAAALHLER